TTGSASPGRSGRVCSPGSGRAWQDCTSKPAGSFCTGRSSPGKAPRRGVHYSLYWVFVHGETGRAISNDPLYRKLFRRLCWPFAVDENQARLSTRSQFSEADVFGTCGAFPERRWVRRLTTTSTTTAAGSAGMTELIASARPVASHIIVTAPPAIIDASAPVAVTRFQNSAASTAGVMAAPYIVYAYICSASTDSKN